MPQDVLFANVPTVPGREVALTLVRGKQAVVVVRATTDCADPRGIAAAETLRLTRAEAVLVASGIGALLKLDAERTASEVAEASAQQARAAETAERNLPAGE